MSEQLVGKRSSFRAIGDPYQGYQEKRRRDALQRQKAARLKSANRARNLALEDEHEDEGEPRELPHSTADGEPRPKDAAEDEEMEASTSYGSPDRVDVEMGTHAATRFRRHGGGYASRRREKHRQSQQLAGGVRAFGQQYGNEMMQPEWMTDIPSDLASNWLVMPRPEGMRCLLVTARGRTVSWLRNGAPLHRFHSPLPGGSPATVGVGGAAAAGAAGPGDYCILDCVFHPPNNTYYIQDLLCWRGYALYDCAAEFRVFWLNNKLHEEGLLDALQAPPLSPADGQQPQADAAKAGVPGSPQVLQRLPQQRQQKQLQQHGGQPGGQQHQRSLKAGAQGRERGRGGGGGGGVGETGSEHGGAPVGDGDDPGAADVEMGDIASAGLLETLRRQQQKQGQQHQAVSYRIVQLPVRPCTLQGLRAAHGSGHDQGHPGTMNMSATSMTTTAAAAAAAAAALTAKAIVAVDTATATAGAAEGSSSGSLPGLGMALTWATGGRSGPRHEADPYVSDGRVDFLRDGLYFLHRQGHYCPGPAASPLALLWKDLGCSRYLVDTDANGAPLEHQLAVLTFRADRTVATEDDPPVVMGRLPEAFVAALGDKIKPGRLLRFSIGQGGILFHEGRPAGADLLYEGFASQRRGRADSFSKILFQRLARTAPITREALEAAISADAASGEAQGLEPGALTGTATGGRAAAALVAEGQTDVLME